jgi:hypothetical protein
MAVILAEM